MDLTNKCRICLREDNNLHSMTSSITPKIDLNTSGVISLWNIYNQILAVHDPALPDTICKECVDEIQQTYLFLIKCEKSESYFRNLLNEELHSTNDSKEYIDITEYKDTILEVDFYKLKPNFCKRTSDLFQEKVENEDLTDEENLSDESDTSFTVNIHDNLSFEIKEITNNVDHHEPKKFHIDKNVDIKSQPNFDTAARQDPYKNSTDKIVRKYRIKCPVCSYQCDGMGILEKHIIDHHMKGNLCKICDRVFKGSPLAHCSVHLRNTYPGSVNESDDYKEPYHRYKRNIASPFKCEFCVKLFRSKTGYSYHLLTKHGYMDENEKILQCTDCSKYFISNSALEQHMRVHSGIKPHICMFCSKKFVQKGHLSVHLRRHTGERPYKCELCPKSFPDKSNYNKHLMLHSGDRPYKCEICPKSFHRKNLLDAHLLCHVSVQSGWKQYSTSRLIRLDQMNRQLSINGL